MSLPLRLLLIEDSEDDAILLLRTLKKFGYEFAHQRVETPESMRAALDGSQWDVIVSDYVIPGFGGLEALKIVKERNLDIPFIIVSGQIGEDSAVSAMKAGAHDYVMKDNLTRLGPAIGRELVEADVRRAKRQAQEALAESERRYRQLALELQQKNAALDEAKQQLEKRVQERTADLTAANAELQRQIRERRRLENELLDITEKERKRIGIDLHDDLGQHLNGIALLLEALQLKLNQKGLPETAEVERIKSLLIKTMNHAHRVAHDLASVDLQNDDLQAALTQLASHAETMFELDCELTTTGQVPALPHAAVKQLYKIAQEAVTNAIKHGKAKKVDMNLETANGDLVMTIRNDGEPFPETLGLKNRMGLRIMHYRAHVIGATVSVKGQGEHGAIVTCSVPLRGIGSVQASAPAA